MQGQTRTDMSLQERVKADLTCITPQMGSPQGLNPESGFSLTGPELPSRLNGLVFSSLLLHIMDQMLMCRRVMSLDLLKP